MRQHRQGNAQQGSMIIYLIAAIAVLSVISLAATGMFSSSSVGTAQVNCPAAAQYLAESGVRYAQGQLRAQADLASLTTMATTLNNTTYTVDDSGTFDLTVTTPITDTDGDGFYDVAISCTSSACDAAAPTQHTIASTVATNIATPGGGEDDGIIEFGDGGIGDFDDAGEENEDFVQKDEDSGTLSLGNNEGASYGCTWYTGDESPCTDGVCDFGSGFRAYFDALLSYNANGDGFVFTIINAENNTIDDCGGDSSRGELLGYGGDGSSGEGIEAPKLGLEFDIYTNSGTNNNFCNVGQRADDTDSRDHSAWIFWGGSSSGDGGCSETYDDNRHGAGQGTADEPRNPDNFSESGDGNDGYYYDESNGSNWLRGYNSSNNDKKFRIRVEVDRAETANADGKYVYTLKGWIRRDNLSLPSGFDDITQDYYSASDTDTWPDVEHSVVLDSDVHNQLDQVIFGWTAGTGGATQIVTLSDFKLKFRDDDETCTADTAATDYVAYYPMDEGEGTEVNDTSSNELHGTLGTDALPVWLAGTGCPDASSIAFADSDDTIVVIDDENELDLTTDGTVAAWVYYNKQANEGGIVVKPGSSDQYISCAYCMAMGRNNQNWNKNRYTMSANIGTQGNNYRISNAYRRVFFCHKNGNSDYACVLTWDATLEYDTWYHFAATWTNAGDMILYRNGVEVDRLPWALRNDGSTSNQPETNNRDLLFGATRDDSNPDDPFNGLIDEVYVYDRALTANEIQALYNDGLHAP